MKHLMTRILILVCASVILAGCNEDTINVTVTPGQINDYHMSAGQLPSDKREPSSLPHNIENCTTTFVPTQKTLYDLCVNNGQNIINNNILCNMSYEMMTWIANTYNNRIFMDLYDTLNKNAYTDSFWHDKTGYSFFVLKDYYDGTISDEQTAKSHNIYIRENTGSAEITMSFAGDLCLSEGWYTLTQYSNSGNQLNQCISQDLIDSLNKSDIFMLNNEFTFSSRGAPLNGKYYTFRADPSRVSILKDLGVDIVSLSNNHVFDYGPDAMYDTMSTLTDAGIPYFGGGTSLSEACSPVYFIVNGEKIAFVGASRAEKTRFTPQATDNSPGILLAYDDTEYLNTIAEAKKNSDFVIAYIHWGTEDSHTVTDYQQSMGKAFIDAGADAVIGGHPHVLQGIEYYNGKPIVYSLGDFWFNYEKKETGVLNLTINSSGLKKVQFLPCMQENYTTILKTEPSDKRAIFDFLQNMSFNISIDDDGYIISNNSS